MHDTLIAKLLQRLNQLHVGFAINLCLQALIRKLPRARHDNVWRNTDPVY